MKKVKSTFLTGLFLFLPVALALYCIVWAFDELDAILEPVYTSILGTYWTGLGFATLLVIVFIIGIIVRSFIGKKFVNLTEKVFSGLPIVKTIYSPVKDILSNVAGDSNNSFQESVLIDFPQKGMQSLGFVTNKMLDVNGQNKVSVFIPTTPNPTNGFLVVVDESDLTYLDMPIEDGIKSVVSMCTTIKKVY